MVGLGLACEGACLPEFFQFAGKLGVFRAREGFKLSFAEAFENFHPLIGFSQGLTAKFELPGQLFPFDVELPYLRQQLSRVITTSRRLVDVPPGLLLE